MRTASDGACALHAVWGAPRKTLEGYELQRDVVREQVLRRVPPMWHEIELRYHGALTAPFHGMIQSKFADVLDGTKDDETGLFEQHLPQNVQEDAAEYRKRLREWSAREHDALRRFRTFCGSFSRSRMSQLSSDPWPTVVDT